MITCRIESEYRQIILGFGIRSLGHMSKWPTIYVTMRLDLIFSPYSIYPDHVKHSHACLHIVYVLVNVYLAGI
jgi:hypothetical protein